MIRASVEDETFDGIDFTETNLKKGEYRSF
jgi:hypothetical protein